MHLMEPQVAVLINQTFQFFVRNLHVKGFTISIARCVGNGVNTPSGTRILFRDLLPVLGVCVSNNNHLLVVCVVVVILLSWLKLSKVVVVSVAVVVVVAAVVAGRIGLGGQLRQWG